ncbi:MAG: serine/threonine-protein kinase, partial [Acidobacteriota bacterium]
MRDMGESGADDWATREAERLLGERRDRRRAGRVFTDGDVVAGRYRILELADRGGEAQVYRAHDLELEHPVALKTLHADLAASPMQLERFKRELLLARSVAHPNVCRLFDWGRHRDPTPDAADVLFVTMEWIDGETLARRVERAGPPPIAEALVLAGQVAHGLAAVHAKGVVHRDVKSQNVLVHDAADGPRAVLGDFGLATDGAEAASQPGPMVTPLTMAPEQISGGEVDPRTDIYSFGVVLYHLTAGRWPFDEKTAVGTAV